jgi:phosphohistidine phosphatase
MQMRLFFLRHGLADRSEWDGEDYLRPLTAKGVNRMKKEAVSIRKLKLGLKAIYTSPLTRASQTAEIVARELQMLAALQIDDRLSPGFGRTTLQRILRDFSSGDRIMLVGHEPDFSLTIESIIGGGNIVCKKASLARVDLFHPGTLDGELVWLIPPKMLAL